MAGRVFLTVSVSLWLGLSAGPALGEGSPATAPATGPASRPADQIVLVRFGDKAVITQADFEKTIRFESAKGYKIRNGIMLGMIMDELLDLYVTDHPDWVTEQEVDARIDKESKVLGFKSSEESRKDYEKNGGDWDRYRRQIRLVLARMKFTDRGERLISDENKLKEIFETRKEEFDGTGVKARQIFFQVFVYASPPERQAVRAKLERMREDILSGKRTWEQCVAECDMPGQNGDLGKFARHMYQPEPVAEAAFKLRDGQMTDIIESPLGYHLVQVLEYVPAKDVPWNTVRQSMRLWLIDEEYYNAMQEMQKKYLVVGVQEPLEPKGPPASRPARRPPPATTHPAPKRKAVFAGDRPKVLVSPRSTGTKPAASGPAAASRPAPGMKTPTSRPARQKPTTAPAR